MPTTTALGAGRSASSGASRNSALLNVPVRSASGPARPVCRPVLLAPGPRSPRRQRSRLVTTNFKQSNEGLDETPIARPKPVRHPLTEDMFAGASPAETATQEVLFGAGTSAAAAAAAPQSSSFFRSTAYAARQMAHLLTRPRALLRAVLRTSASYGLPLLLAYFARNPLMSFWSFYCASLDSHPLLTKIATGIVGTIVGDYVAQKLSHQNEAQSAQLRGEPAPPFVFDAVRTSRLVIYGALVGTPVGHAWFQLLDKHVMPDAMTSAQAVLTKMAMDQFFMSPLSTALFFVVMRCWEGHSNDAMAYMCKKMVPTMKANYVLWPMAHIINFAFVPPSQRILYCNAVGVVWTVILSTILNSKAPSAAAAVPAPTATHAVAGGASTGAAGSSDGGPSSDGSFGQAGFPRHAHAAFTPGAGSSSTGMFGDVSCGFESDTQQPLNTRKGAVSSGAPVTRYVRLSAWELNNKDA